MRLLIAADIFPPQSGGPATYSVTLANELSRQGHEVRIVSLNPESDESAVECFLFAVHFRNKLLRYLEYWWLLFLHALESDVVYAMGPVNAGLPALAAARLARKQFAVKVVGDYAWEQGTQRYGVSDAIDDFQKRDTYPFLVRLLRLIQRRVTRSANLVITPSQYLKNMIIGWGVSSSAIEVVYNAVEVGAFTPAAKEAEERWIVTAARLTPWKGVSALIDCMPKLLLSFPNVRLKVIGNGPAIADLVEKVNTLGLSNDIRFLGNIPRKEALGFIAAADVFVLNSGYEGLSHVLLEALMLQRIVCASHVGGNTELISEDKNGFLFQYNNVAEITRKIEAALRGPNSLLDPGIDGLRQQFSVSHMVEHTRMVLEKNINH